MGFFIYFLFCEQFGQTVKLDCQIIKKRRKKEEEIQYILERMPKDLKSDD